MLIMKKIITIFAAFAVLMSFASCERPEPDGPDVPDVPNEVTVTFPDLVENYEVKPGDTFTLTFTPAKDWTVSVPSDNLQWFWIADGSFKVDKLSGKASETAVTVNIGVSETEEFDMNRSCDVTLQIGDESKVIAKYMRPAKERTLSVYMAELSESGDFKLAEDGASYVYGTEEVASVAFAWSASNSDFRAPVRVESNGEWTAVYPEWMTLNVPEKTTGVVELVLTGESLDAAEGKIEFKAGDNVIKEVEVTIPSCKGVDVYSATVNDGEFDYDGSGDYAWTAEAVNEVTLEWLGADFRMPVKVSSKCNWTLVLPEWLTAEVPSETAGDISFTLLGVPSKYPLEDTSDKIVFKSGDTVIHEMKVSIPGCKDILTYAIDMALTELDFNAAGDVMTSTGYADVDVTATVFGTSKVNVHAIELVGGKYVTSGAPEWLTVTVAAFNTAADAPVLQDREVTVKVSENTGDERKAILLFAPHSLSGNIASAFEDDLSAVKEEYEQYVVNVSQISNKFVINMNSSAEAMAEAGASFEAASDVKTAELTAAFGQTDQVYVLTYDNIYALDEARMSMTRAFASVKVFDSEKTDQSAVENFWLAFRHAEEMNSGVVEMYFNNDPSLLPALPTAPSTGYVVFYDASGNTLAIIECVSPYKEEEIVTPPEENLPVDGVYTDEYGNKYVENTSYFTDAAAAEAAGAKLYEVKSGDYYDQYKENECPILILEYPSAETEVEIQLPEKTAYWQVMPYVYNELITVNGNTIYDTSGLLFDSEITDKVRIRMSEDVASMKDEIETGSADRPAGLKVMFHKNMGTMQPMFVIFCRMTISE